MPGSCGLAVFKLWSADPWGPRASQEIFKCSVRKKTNILGHIICYLGRRPDTVIGDKSWMDSLLVT